MNNRVLLVFILNKLELLDDVVTLFVELGIGGATILESTGMARYLSDEIPIFAGFREILQGTRASNRTIFTVVEEEMIPQIIKGLEEVVGPLSDPGTGVAFTIPVYQSWGIL